MSVKCPLVRSEKIVGSAVQKAGREIGWQIVAICRQRADHHADDQYTASHAQQGTKL